MGSSNLAASNRRATIYDISASLVRLSSAVIQQFKFTESESLLCLGLVQGKSLYDLAEELQLSRERLWQDYNNLLQKTGVDTEAKLISVILSSYS